MTDPTWRELSRTVVDMGDGIRIGEALVAEPGGSVVRRKYLHTPEVVAIVAVSDGMLILLREYRAAVGTEVWQAPMGKVTDGRSPDECALVELAEETGYRAARCQRVGTLLACPGWMDQVLHVYLATELDRLAVAPSSDDPDDVEEAASTVVPVPVGDFGALVRSGEIRDARTIAAVTIAVAR